MDSLKLPIVWELVSGFEDGLGGGDSLVEDGEAEGGE